jgi:hypothetical protein
MNYRVYYHFVSEVHPIKYFVAESNLFGVFNSICWFQGVRYFDNLDAMCKDVNSFFDSKNTNFIDIKPTAHLLAEFNTLEEFRQHFAEYFI